MRRVVQPPYGVEDLAIGHRPSRVAFEGHQELALERSEVNLSAIDDEHPPLPVNLEVGRERLGRDVRLSRATHLPQPDADAAEQVRRGEGLDEVVAGAGVQELDSFLLSAVRQQGQDRRRGPVAQARGQSYAVDVGMADVDDDEIRLVADRSGQRPSHGADVEAPVAEARQSRHEQPPHLRLVFYDEHERLNSRQSAHFGRRHVPIHGSPEARSVVSLGLARRAIKMA